MSEFVKKTMMGYKEVQNGQSDPECTHVILTEKEYSKLLRKVADAEQGARVTKINADREIQQERRAAQSRISIVEYEATQKVSALEKTLEGLKEALAAEQKESAYQRNLNTTLLRISKERANADRKLKPKKEHTGYVVTYSAEKEYRYKIDRRNWGRVMLWETVLQSPYSADFEEQQARTQIWEDLFRICKDNTWEIGRIGLDAYWRRKYEELIEKPIWKETYVQKNVLLLSESKLRLNFKQMYWEVVIQHTKPLCVVPPDMRARQN